MQRPPFSQPPIYTIGYFGLEWITFLSLLTRFGIKTILDVRALPTSPFLPCFSRTGLEHYLPLWGRSYQHLGAELGGRRSPSGLEDAVSLDRGLERVMAAWRTGRRIALFCIEEDPWRCHRGNRLAPILIAKGAQVVHIRGDGRLEPHPVVAHQDAIPATPREEPR